MQNLLPAEVSAGSTVYQGVYVPHLPRRLVGCSPKHASLKLVLLDELFGVADGLDSSVKSELQVRELLLQLVHVLVLEWRDVSVLRRVQSLEMCLPGVNDEVSDLSYTADSPDEVLTKLVGVEVVDPQPTLHCAGERSRLVHGLHKLGYQLRLLHQTRTEHVALHFG